VSEWDFFVRLRIRKSNLIIFCITLLIWNSDFTFETFLEISFETFIETDNSCCDFHLIASCYKIVYSQT